MRGLAEWALIRSSKKGSRRMVKFFLPAAQSPESRMLALHAAVENNKIGTAEILLNANAPIDARNEDGFAAIHFAANETNQHMIQLLLDNNAFVDLPTTEYGDTALHLVARTRHTNTSNDFQGLAASTLVSGGANINAQNIQRHTPLHLAIYHEGTDVASPNGSVARFLVESDANLFLVNNFNHTPLSWAQLHLVEALIPFLQVSESAKRTPMDLDA